MICQKCGHEEQNINSMYCGFCGAKFDILARKQVTSYMQTQKPSYNNPQLTRREQIGTITPPKTSYSTGSKKYSIFGFLLSLFSLGLGAGAGLFGFIFYRTVGGSLPMGGALDDFYNGLPLFIENSSLTFFGFIIILILNILGLILGLISVIIIDKAKKNEGDNSLKKGGKLFSIIGPVINTMSLIIIILNIIFYLSI